MKLRGYISDKYGRPCEQKKSGWFHGFITDDDYGRLNISGVSKNILCYDMEYDVVNDTPEYYYYNHPQYKIQSIQPHIEMTKDGIKQYLCSDSFKGIGQKTAEKIVDAFGEETIEVIKNDIQKLYQLGLTELQINALISGCNSTSIENRLRKEIPFITENLINKIINKYKKEDQLSENEIINIVLCDTYKLLYDINVKFETIDKIVLYRNGESCRYSKQRIKECFKYELQQYINESKNVFITTYNDGSSTSTPYTVFLNNVQKDIVNGCTDPNCYQKAFNIINDIICNNIDMLSDVAVIEPFENDCHIYTRETYDEEAYLAKALGYNATLPCLFKKAIFIPDMMTCIESDIKTYERKHGIKFDDSQLLAIKTSLCSRISIINGGPGHGKTSTLDCILEIWSKHNDKVPVLSAPTGRAVTVLKNATGNQYKVATAMRRITMYKKYRKNDATKFAELKDKYSNTLVVLDECSMVGIRTAYEYMKLFQNCQFIFVGDVDQLPSIEYGQFFKDICESNMIIKSELTVNHRADADGRLIVENAKAINRQEIQNIDFSTDAFSAIPFQNDSDSADAIIQLYSDYVYDVYKDSDDKIIKKLNLDNMKRICILAPMKGRMSGVTALNKRIQEMVNPEDNHAKSNQRGYTIANERKDKNGNIIKLALRVGDHVMQSVNRTDVVCQIISGNKRSDSVGIYNGDAGFIEKYNDDGSVDLLLDDGRYTTLPKEYADDLQLAYAMTIHKSQGSEYDDVLLSSQYLIGFNETFACKNLFYTAVTRAKKHVKIIGDIDSFYYAINNALPSRKSMLAVKMQTAYKCYKE